MGLILSQEAKKRFSNQCVSRQKVGLFRGINKGRTKEALPKVDDSCLDGFFISDHPTHGA